jgi:hypothetical protein
MLSTALSCSARLWDEMRDKVDKSRFMSGNSNYLYRHIFEHEIQRGKHEQCSEPTLSHQSHYQLAVIVHSFLRTIRLLSYFWLPCRQLRPARHQSLYPCLLPSTKRPIFKPGTWESVLLALNISLNSSTIPPPMAQAHTIPPILHSSSNTRLSTHSTSQGVPHF